MADIILSGLVLLQFDIKLKKTIINFYSVRIFSKMVKPIFSI
jgi:hypothetical protein